MSAHPGAIDLPPSSFDAPRRTILPLPSLPSGIEAIADDFNGDGLDDLLVLRNGIYFPRTEILLYRGLCDGSFVQAFQQRLEWDHLDVGDFNHDGSLDLAIGASEFYSADASGQVEVLLGTPTGFESSFSFKVSGLSILGLTVTDLDRDHHPDIVVSTFTRLPTHPNGLTLFHGDGSGRNFELRPLGVDGRPILAGDANNDGWPDLVLPSGVALNDGAGNLSEVIPIAKAPSGYSIGRTWLEDNDGDGDRDLFVTYYEEDDQNYYWCHRWHQNAGNRAFEPQTEYCTSFPSYDDPEPLRLIDVDRDGIGDLVGWDQYSRRVTIRPGRPGGVFGPTSCTRDFHQVFDFTVVDAAGDGTLDLVVLDYWGIAVVPLNLDGSPGITPVLELSASLDQLDVTGDGLEDLRVGDQIYRRIWMGMVTSKW